MASFAPGQIVIADWRDVQPREANKLRPAIVIEDSRLFGESYPSVILVPITEDAEVAASSWRAKARHPPLAAGDSVQQAAWTFGFSRRQSWMAGLRLP